MSKNDLPISPNPIKTTLSFCVEFGNIFCKVILKIEGNIIIKIQNKNFERKSEFSKKLSRLKTNSRTTNVKSKNIAELTKDVISDNLENWVLDL